MGYGKRAGAVAALFTAAGIFRVFATTPRQPSITALTVSSTRVPGPCKSIR